MKSIENNNPNQLMANSLIERKQMRASFLVSYEPFTTTIEFLGLFVIWPNESKSIVLIAFRKNQFRTYELRKKINSATHPVGQGRVDETVDDEFYFLLRVELGRFDRPLVLGPNEVSLKCDSLCKSVSLWQTEVVKTLLVCIPINNSSVNICWGVFAERW